MSSAYVRGKFGSAVKILNGPGDVRDNLTFALSTCLLNCIKPDGDLSGEAHASFVKLHKDMTRYDALASEGKIKATVMQLDDVEIKKAVATIHALYKSMSTNTSA